MSTAKRDAVVVGAGPNGLAAAITLAAGRAARHGVRGRGDARRRLPHRRADAARLPPRRLLDRAVAGRALAVLPRPRPRARSGYGCAGPRSRSRTRSTAAAPRAAYADLERTAPRRWARTARPGGRCSARWSRGADRADARRRARRPAPRAASPAAAGALRAARPAARDDRWPGPGSAPTPPARCSPGLGAHSMRRLTAPLTSAFGLVLGVTAHAGGWPVVEGGSGRLVDAAGRAGWPTLGVELVCDHPRDARCASCPRPGRPCSTSTPRQLIELAGDDLPAGYRRRLHRFRYGAGVFKIDYALSGPVPWTGAGVPGGRAPCTWAARSRRSRPSEAAVEAGRHSDRPYVLVVQPERRRPHPRAGRAAHAVGLLPRPQRLDPATAPTRSRASSSGSRPASATSSWPARPAPRPGTRPTTRTTSAVTSTAGGPGCTRLLLGPDRRLVAVPDRAAAACTCARRPRRPAAACTACAACTPPVRRCGRELGSGGLRRTVTS